MNTSLQFASFARVTWQRVTQSSVNEGESVVALNTERFSGNGIRGVLGLSLGSISNQPTKQKYTYRAYVGVGADSQTLLNPSLNASLVGLPTTVTTPKAGTGFVEAGLYGTAKFADNTYVYAGVSGEARSGQTLGSINLGINVRF